MKIENYKQIIAAFISILLLFSLVGCAKIQENTDIENYARYFGNDAVEPYKYKLINDDIFPERITENMNVEDFKMVYYNPFDPQYLSYLIVEYDENDYQNELNRLNGYTSTEYVGYYGATGFNDKYELLAMNADSSNGFVYALSNGSNKIIYVEIMFCNHFMDLEYENYIKEEYLPIGFDAKLDNPYQKKTS